MSMLATLLLSGLALQTQTPTFAEALVLEGGLVPGWSGGSRVERIYYPSAGQSGGWVASVRASVAGDSELGLLVGQRPSDVGGAVRLIRRPETIQGYVQSDLKGPSMANGQVAYLESEQTLNSRGRSVWVDDQRIARVGDTVPSRPGWTWTTFRTVRIGTSGSTYVRGQAETQTPQDFREVLWVWPAGNVLVAEGEPLPGITSTVNTIGSEISTSPSGARWAVSVSEQGTGRDAVVVDGQVLDIGGGALLKEGEVLPPTLLGPGMQWYRVGWLPALNDFGDYALNAEARDSANNRTWFQIRNGRRFDSDPGVIVYGIDETGAVLSHGWDDLDELRLEGSVILEDAPNVEIDLNRDGVAEPSLGLFSLGAFSVIGANGSSSTVFAAPISRNGTYDYRWAVFQARNYRIDRVACDGLPNSTGEPGRMAAAGSRKLGDNDISLEMYSLPESSTGYGLLSRTFNLTPFAGGSQGTLCLGGSIGRELSQVYTTDDTGRASIRFDLTAIPQPMGSISASAGETWYAQSWFRDSVNGQATSNFTSAVSIPIE